MQTEINRELYKTSISLCRKDWNIFARDVLKIRLDPDQQNILDAIQHNRRVSVRSGTARGKDYVGAVASYCFMVLSVFFDENKVFHPAKVVMTAPTGRQIRNIMMPEISKLYSKWQLPGSVLLSDGIRMFDKRFKDWFLTGFKADDTNIEAWSGLHAPNMMVLVTEASGISDITFNAIEGILQGNSRLVLIFNPNRTIGEAYQSTKSPLYTKFKLSSLDSINVREKKIIIPGQVDYEWVAEKLRKPGWVVPISKEEANLLYSDFEFDGKWYRPGELFRVKVLAEFPEEGEDVLIPLSWIEQANQRWLEAQEDPNFTYVPIRKIGVDIAGMGRDETIFTDRYGNYVKSIYPFLLSKKDATIHMQIAGKIKNMIEKGGYAYIDTIGEGAGVYSRLEEEKVFGANSVKFSENANGLTDKTGARKFLNMRAYLLWAVRDALNPVFGENLMLPPSEELTEELSNILYKITGNGSIQIEAKEDIKKRIGRSPDYSDSLANTFYPEGRSKMTEVKTYTSKAEIGIF